MEILEFINHLRETDKYICDIYTKGGCYRLAVLLKKMYGGTVVINRDKDHAGLDHEGVVYDINGVNNWDDWDDPTDEDFKEMEHWSFANTRALSIGECQVCEEPILV